MHSIIWRGINEKHSLVQIHFPGCCLDCPHDGMSLMRDWCLCEVLWVCAIQNLQSLQVTDFSRAHRKTRLCYLVSLIAHVPVFRAIDFPANFRCPSKNLPSREIAQKKEKDEKICMPICNARWHRILFSLIHFNLWKM